MDGGGRRKRREEGSVDGGSRRARWTAEAGGAAEVVGGKEGSGLGRRARERSMRDDVCDGLNRVSRIDKWGTFPLANNPVCSPVVCSSHWRTPDAVCQWYALTTGEHIGQFASGKCLNF